MRLSRRHTTSFMSIYNYIYISLFESYGNLYYVKLKVDSNGKISLSNIEISPKTKELLPGFDSIVKVSIESLPILQPAIKRDMPVTTEFTLPIILTN